MESYRAEHQLSRKSRRHRQAGITAIGFLLLAVVFGTLGLAVMKIAPLYLERMRIEAVLEDLQTEMAAGGNTVTGIQNALESRFYIENVKVPRDEIEIARKGEGFVIKINRESRAPFFADLWFVVVIDEQIEISR
jgi:hypothetical protein